MLRLYYSGWNWTWNFHLNHVLPIWLKFVRQFNFQLILRIIKTLFFNKELKLKLFKKYPSLAKKKQITQLIKNLSNARLNDRNVKEIKRNFTFRIMTIITSSSWCRYIKKWRGRRRRDSNCKSFVYCWVLMRVLMRDLLEKKRRWSNKDKSLAIFTCGALGIFHHLAIMLLSIFIFVCTFLKGKKLE